jgi:D-amino peptidase
MRLFILTDAEGTAGVVDFWNYSRPGYRYHETARELVTKEVNAAIEGALEAGVTSVHVVDGHGPGCMNVELLHPEATILTGRPIRYPFGLDDSYDLVFMTGYHAKSNTDGGHLSHSWQMLIEEMWINGVSIGEIGTWLIVAGQIGLPVPLLTGDRAACGEARTLIPNIRTVVTKDGWKSGPATWLTEDGNRSHNGGATHIHPEKARSLIREAATLAVHEVGNVSSYRMDPPYEIVTIQRPQDEKDPHLISRCVADDWSTIMTVPREWEPLEEDLTSVIESMNTNGRLNSQGEHR